jgi:hypothetical protein
VCCFIPAGSWFWPESLGVCCLCFAVSVCYCKSCLASVLVSGSVVVAEPVAACYVSGAFACSATRFVPRSRFLCIVFSHPFLNEWQISYLTLKENKAHIINRNAI